jgi:SAM-dependent methyltransferase
MQNFWNQRYDEPDFAYGTQPNAFFAQMIDTLPPGRLLLPGEGEGRQAVYAANRGWEVVAVDYSEAGREKALRLAAEQGVDFSYTIADLSTYAPEGAFDLVAMIFLHLPPTIRSAVHSKLAAALRPGGHLLAEVFRPEQLGRDSGGPKKLEMLYDEASLRADFPGFTWQQFEACEVELDEGPYHQGKAAVWRLLGEKK